MVFYSSIFIRVMTRSILFIFYASTLLLYLVTHSSSLIPFFLCTVNLYSIFSLYLVLALKSIRLNGNNCVLITFIDLFDTPTVKLQLDALTSPRKLSDKGWKSCCRRSKGQHEEDRRKAVQREFFSERSSASNHLQLGVPKVQNKGTLPNTSSQTNHPLLGS